MLRNYLECGKLTVQEGFLICPTCRFKKMQRIRPETEGVRVPVFCRKCKQEMLVDIRKGQCFKSQS